ncbi:MAG TPA: alpha/beta hydrolase [Thermohalobaculum sp.]|nr:alpha/beta hydrolase [Thermohalobaculum sp.]
MSIQITARITDPEILAFIERTAAFYPEGKANLALAERRRQYDAMAAALRRPRPEALRVTDETVPGPAGPVPVRRYLPPDPGPVTVLYFHGGGFVLGGLDSHDDVSAEIAARTSCPVLAVDYRLCPEHIHPAAYDDALAATRAALAHGPVILAGDSAGANLAAAVCLALKDGGIRGQVLIYPTLGGDLLGLASYEENAEAPMLTTRDMEYYRRTRAGGPVPHDDPTFFPFAAADFSGLAPCFISSAEADPLRDDGPEYARRLGAAGVEARCVVEPQLPHGHLRARHTARRAAEAFDRVIAAIADFAGR